MGGNRMQARNENIYQQWSVAIGKPERQVRKASHYGSKQQ